MYIQTLLDNITYFNIAFGKTIDFTYSADGNKLRKVGKTGAPINLVQVEDPVSNEMSIGEYVNGIEYRGTAIPANTIEAAYHAEGRVYNSAGSWKREYTIKDHLGNTRLAYCDLNNDGVVASPSEILQENNYDAFGYELSGVYMNHVNNDNLYQYNGKEKNDDHGIGLYDYGARWYDPSIARFTGVDPIADKFPHVTTYNYAENSPIANIDLWGLQAENFMSKFRKTENLPVKTIHNGYGEVQRQHYEVTVAGSEKSFGDFKSSFMLEPGKVLSNSKAEFGKVNNADGSSGLKEGSNIGILIDGPLNDSKIRASSVEVDDNGFKASFNTLEGHVEAGNISFSASVDKNGNITFKIDGTSRISHGAGYALAEGKARESQTASWKQVLNNITNYLKGTEQSRSIQINRYEYDKNKPDGIGKPIQ